MSHSNDPTHTTNIESKVLSEKLSNVSLEDPDIALHKSTNPTPSTATTTPLAPPPTPQEASDESKYRVADQGNLHRPVPEPPLPCIADFAIYPLGTTIPFRSFIDKVEAILKELGLKYKIHKQGTTIEGEMMAIMHGIKTCHQAVHHMGCPRIVSNIRVDTGMDNYKEE